MPASVTKILPAGLIEKEVASLNSPIDFSYTKLWLYELAAISNSKNVSNLNIIRLNYLKFENYYYKNIRIKIINKVTKNWF
ncbi:MAG: hypothetical protein D8M61_02320 [Ignavibacteriae bacterium]|nr:hypothetical protein [Ignavibacteriota bacterium]